MVEGRNCDFINSFLLLFHAATGAEKMYMGLFRQGGTNCVKQCSAHLGSEVYFLCLIPT